MLEDYSNNIDFVINPLTNIPIEKYGHTWYYLIRKGYNENNLENLPIITQSFVINPKTKQPMEKYSKTWYDLIQQGYSKLNELPIINKPINKVTYVNQLDLNLNKPQRGGVILYTIVDGRLLFGFGLDSTYDELTDFSGGIKYKKDKNLIDGALREFREESEGLYFLNKEDVIHSPVLIDKHNVIMFLYTSESPDEITYQFQNQYGHKSEIKNIVWVTEDELRSALELNLTYIYSRVKNFLIKFGDFYQYLK